MTPNRRGHSIDTMPSLRTLRSIDRRNQACKRLAGAEDDLDRQLIQLFGMHQRLALIAHQRSGREFVRAAFAVANKFGSDCGRHGFEERSLILTEAQLRGLRGVVEGAEDFKRSSRSEFGGDLHAHEEDHHADKPAERNPAA